MLSLLAYHDSDAKVEGWTRFRRTIARPWHGCGTRSS